MTRSATLEGRALFSGRARCPWVATHPPPCVAARQLCSAASQRGSSGSGAAAAPHDTGVTTLAPPSPSSPPALQQTTAGLASGGGSSSSSAGQTELQRTEDIVGWFCEAYALAERRRVRAPLRRALAALKAADPQRTRLSLERDILPKLELLEGLSPGLGWKVFARYPEELVHPDAADYWGIMAAYLYTTGFTPQKISALFTRHPCLFSRVVQDPDNLRRLFAWLGELGFDQGAVVRLVGRAPLLLQMDVETVLKPRLQFLLGLPLPLPRAVAALRRQPELLLVDSASLQQRVDYLMGLGLTRAQVGALCATDPAALLSSVEAKFAPVVAWLREGLGCEPALLAKLITKAGLLTRSLETLQERTAHWRGLGFSAPQLLRMLDRFPRLLLYPMAEPKYSAKLEFLGEGLRLPLSALEAFPQYVSYSLEGRIAPRAAAAAQLARRPLSLPQLATSDAAFCKHYGIDLAAYAHFLRDWGSRRGGGLPPPADAELGAPGLPPPQH